MAFCKLPALLWPVGTEPALLMNRTGKVSCLQARKIHISGLKVESVDITIITEPEDYSEDCIDEMVNFNYAKFHAAVVKGGVEFETLTFTIQDSSYNNTDSRDRMLAAAVST